MNLKSIVENISKPRIKDSKAGLFNSAKAELYFRQSYQGRFLFELIQNVRDANKISNVLGSVYITLQEDALIISNSGSPFSEKGVNSITMIGDSTKESLDFIGHKGIGFKSIYEVSENPKVITQWGTIEFSKEKTQAVLVEKISNLEHIPLFFVPHYSNNRLSQNELQKGIVTKIVLPFKAGVSRKSIEGAFEQIAVHQILLLGYLKEISFTTSKYSSLIKIEENQRSGRVQINKNLDISHFRHFKTTQGYSIPRDIIESLEEGDRGIYEKDPTIQISLVFETNKAGRLVGVAKSKLYLFYPTEISSGFNFIIHSFFIVNPERKALRASPLNDFILECIADYIANDWLKIVQKKHLKSYLDLLAFDRNTELPMLNRLYSRLVSNLKQIKFIYDPLSDMTYRASEVIVASDVEQILFPDYQIGKKRLITIPNTLTRKWLIKEFGTEELNYANIADNIERQCKIQKNKRNFGYFDHLYDYLVKNNSLDLSDKRILLTTKMTLLSSQDDVFYGLNEKIEFRESVQKKIHFIHSKIKIRKPRLGQNQTGFIEYSAEQLLRRVIALYNHRTVSPSDILDAILKIRMPEKTDIDFKKRVLLPVGSADEWVRPLESPVYLPTEELIELFPSERFIRMEEFKELNLDEQILRQNLLRLGAWEEPAIFFNKSRRRIDSNSSELYRLLQHHSPYKSTPHFNLSGDWKLDLPFHINEWFTRKIVNGWSRYLEMISGENNQEIRYSSAQSYEHRLPRHLYFYLSSFRQFLVTEAWISNQSFTQTMAISEVIFFDPMEFKLPQSLIIKKFINIFPISLELNRDMISKLRLLHLDEMTLENFRKILLMVSKMYGHKVDYDREFVNFYHRILNKLYDCYSDVSFDRSKIIHLSDVEFLSIDEINNKFEWRPACEIYYIEDLHGYEILPSNIKKLIQPQFSNRNKNKFGQIAKRLGKDFRKTIVQKISNEVVLFERDFCSWFSYLPEIIALSEVLMYENLDGLVAILKKTKIKVCNKFDLELYQDNVLVHVLNDVNYKIIGEKEHVIFIKDQREIDDSTFNANLFYDLLVNLLDKDLTRLRFNVNSFFDAKDKYNYLMLHEVPVDRVDEIKQIMNSKLLTDRQYFWNCILELKGYDSENTIHKGEAIEFQMISEICSVSVAVLLEIDKKINYSILASPENLAPTKVLIEILKCSLSELNQAGLNLDFRKYFNAQLDGLKVKYKSQFESRLYQYLSGRSAVEQSDFQSEMDAYESWTLERIQENTLELDIKAYFFEHILRQYPHLFFSYLPYDNVVQEDLTLLYNGNYKQLSAMIAEKDAVHLSTFLDISGNRSRLYFSANCQGLAVEFNIFLTKIDEEVLNETDSEGVNGFAVKTGLTITKVKTNAVEKNEKDVEKGNKNGNRGDGAKGGVRKSLVGLIAELQVYTTLKENFETVEWVSKNAANAKVNPEGSDYLGYDIRYVDHDNITRYVEVKGKSDEKRNFYISYQEYKAALAKKEFYSIYLVSNTLDVNNRSIDDIGNIFLFEKKYDLMNNPAFSANFSVLEINYSKNG